MEISRLQKHALIRVFLFVERFAAEVFHDLHEEVISTAARGHSLMIRVQQLEAEVPSIEKAFLSQTNHTSFFTSTGQSIVYIVIFLPTIMVTTLFILMDLNN